MRIRWIPLLVSFVAASMAVGAAVGFGAALLPMFKAGFLRISNPALIGAWLAIFGGVVTSIIVATRSHDDGEREGRRRKRHGVLNDRTLRRSRER